MMNYFTREQVRDVQRAAIYVSELRRVGKGLGVFEFDRYISEEGAGGDNVVAADAGN
jgi:hypothetical protein